MIFKNLKGEVALETKHNASFFVFEGIDGSGKTTQANMLAEYLRQKGVEVLLTKEPTKETPESEKIRKVLRKELMISTKELQILFAEDRRAHLKNSVIPALESGKTVISDRYVFSSLAYGLQECEKQFLIQINENFILPTKTFMIDVSPAWGMEKMEKRGEKKEFFEEKEKLEKIRKEYNLLAKEFESIEIINGERPIQEIHQEIINILNKYIR
ncbi:dTMP kinase [Candidatus Jorgensenbacteria bacterium RIFCSPLOWO2_01_FULL_45_25b]|uniref:Thymidylate kinase n=1 Tax=Candidatus Jorgensenbacteria bacterium RIFCSPLOWO2_01_FULL_45_25b TaxID=1798471 RepID=A0A1F6BZ55_9BACT|nr:MAG: dTMP kinase [Candidatus Jorgensenbacteria bacterium RIFCSPLOWO2_01_FULL_45_25b]